jgi:hypothetical protein
MSTGIYQVASPSNIAVPRVDGVDAVLVAANSAAEATALAQGVIVVEQVLWNGTNSPPVLATGVTDLNGWTFNFQVTTIPVNVTYVGIAGDTLATVFAALSALINAEGVGITHAGFASNTFTFVGASDSIATTSDTVTITVTPPAGLFTSTYTFSDLESATPAGFIGTVTKSASGTASTVAISSTWQIPGVVAGYKQRLPALAEYGPEQS